MRTLACPASLKHVLPAPAAAAALAAGLRAGGAAADELPLADGGEGTAAVLEAALGGRRHHADVHDAFGAPRRAAWLELPDGTAVVEAAAAVPLDPARLDVRSASSRGLGELILATGRAPALLVALGGTATMDAGEGLREVLRELPAPTQVACDVRTTLLDAPRLYGPQKGASPEQVEELTRRFAASGLPQELPGGGAAGGLGAALAALGAELVPGAELVLDALAFEPSRYDLVVTGEGRVDATTAEGKVAAAVAARCAAAGVRCVVFGGVVDAPLPGVETVALSGDPARAEADLRALGERLARLGVA